MLALMKSKHNRKHPFVKVDLIEKKGREKKKRYKNYFFFTLTELLHRYLTDPCQNLRIDSVKQR